MCNTDDPVCQGSVPRYSHLWLVGITQVLLLAINKHTCAFEMEKIIRVQELEMRYHPLYPAERKSILHHLAGGVV